MSVINNPAVVILRGGGVPSPLPPSPYFAAKISRINRLAGGCVCKIFKLNGLRLKYCKIRSCGPFSQRQAWFMPIFRTVLLHCSKDSKLEITDRTGACCCLAMGFEILGLDTKKWSFGRLKPCLVSLRYRSFATTTVRSSDCSLVPAKVETASAMSVTIPD